MEAAEQEESVANPAIPSSLGALLAEEWTINPYSVLPSFLEMVMIQEASRSTRRAIGAAIDAIEQQALLGMQEESSESESEMVSDEATTTTTSRMLSTIRSFLRQWRVRTARILVRILGRHKAELGGLLIYLMERRCLHSSACATVSESLYGTKRSKLLLQQQDRDSPSNQRKLVELSSSDRTRVALLAAFGPYLIDKLNHLYHRWRRMLIEPPPNNSSRVLEWSSSSRRRRVFVMAYPFVRAILRCSNLLCQWRFLLGRSVFYDLSTLLLGQVVRRVTLADKQESSSSGKGPEGAEPTNNKKNSSSSEQAGGGSSPPVLLKSVLYLVSTSILVSWLTQLQADWQRYRRERRMREAAQNHPEGSSNGGLIPPPPPPPPTYHSLRDIPADRCPICRQHRVIPTASTSGYVFCLSCLLPYIRQYGKCPITGTDCPESRLVRLYEPRHEDEDR